MNITLFDSEAAWLEAKKGKVSASKISKLLTNGKGADGLSVGAKSYLLELFAETVADDVIEPYISIDMQHGKDEESVAVEELGKLYPFDNIEHFGGHQYMFCEYNDFSGCSPDALISNNAGVYLLGTEIKCPTSKRIHVERVLTVHDNESLKSHDSDIYDQIQHNMLCFGLNEWLFVSFYRYMHDPSKRLHVVKITSDAERQELMKAKIEAGKKYFNELAVSFRKEVEI